MDGGIVRKVAIETIRLPSSSPFMTKKRPQSPLCAVVITNPPPHLGIALSRTPESSQDATT